MKPRRTIRIAPGFEHLRPLIERVPQDAFPVLHTYCDRRNTVQRVRMGDTDAVVKRFRRPNLINSLVYTHLRACKADRSFDNAMRFMHMDIPTPRPVAVITDHCGPFLTDSWYVSLHIDARPIGATVTERDRPRMDTMFDSMQMLREFLDFTAALFAKQVYQRDFNRGNFLAMQDDGGHWTFPMVDINRVQYTRVTPDMVAMAFTRFGAELAPGLVERLTLDIGRRLGLDTDQCRRAAAKAVNRGFRIERRRQIKRAIRRRLHRG